MQQFYIRTDVTLGLWMLLFGSLLTFCESTYWPLIIDVCMYVRMYICIKGQYMLSQRVNKFLNDNIHRPNVTSLRI